MVRRVVVRRVVVEVVQLQRRRSRRSGRSGRPARRQARAPFLVAPAADAPGVGGARLAARAVGAGVEQPPAADAAPLHTNPSTRAGSGWFSTASTAMHSAMIASFGVRVVRLVQPPAAAAVAGDRVRRVLVQLRRRPGSCSRRSVTAACSRARGRDHARVGLREGDAQRRPRAPARRRAGRPATGRTRPRAPRSRAASSRITSPASSTASSPWPIQTPTRRSSVTHATAVAERWPPTSTPTQTVSPSSIAGERRRTPATRPAAASGCARSVHWFATNRRNARSGRPARACAIDSGVIQLAGFARLTARGVETSASSASAHSSNRSAGAAGVRHGAAAASPGAAPAPARAAGRAGCRRPGRRSRSSRAGRPARLCIADAMRDVDAVVARAPAARRRSPASRSGRAACGRRRPTPPASASRPSRGPAAGTSAARR